MKRLFMFAALSSFSLALAARPPSGDNQNAAQTPPQMTQMQARMQSMRALMERIQTTEDPQARQRLMNEHMQSMHGGMTMMGDMMRAPTGQGGQMQQCEQKNTECRMERMQAQQGMMEQHMGMMQMMMEQMMKHASEQATEKPQ